MLWTDIDTKAAAFAAILLDGDFTLDHEFLTRRSMGNAFTNPSGDALLLGRSRLVRKEEKNMGIAIDAQMNYRSGANHWA